MVPGAYHRIQFMQQASSNLAPVTGERAARPVNMDYPGHPQPPSPALPWLSQLLPIHGNFVTSGAELARFCAANTDIPAENMQDVWAQFV